MAKDFYQTFAIALLKRVDSNAAGEPEQVKVDELSAQIQEQVAAAILAALSEDQLEAYATLGELLPDPEKLAVFLREKIPDLDLRRHAALTEFAEDFLVKQRAAQVARAA